MATPSSPLQHRLHEKEELGELNDRLGIYIRSVQELKDKNHKLNQELGNARESYTQQLELTREEYDSELTAIRRTLDDTSTDKARFQLEAQQHEAKVEELGGLLESERSERKRLSKELENAVSSRDRATAESSTARKVSEEALEALRRTERERDQYMENAKNAEELLQQMTLDKVQKENALLSIREDLSFKTNASSRTAAQLNSEISDLRKELAGAETELKKKYEEQLAAASNAARTRYEEEAETYHETLKAMYAEKLAQLSHSDPTLALLQAENDELRSQVSNGSLQLLAAQKQVMELELRIQTLEKDLKHHQATFQTECATRDALINKQKISIAERDAAYSDLMDVRLALDGEIAAFRKLLEGEEERLGLPSPSRASRSPKPTKRKSSSPPSEHEEQHDTANKRTRSAKRQQEAAATVSKPTEEETAGMAIRRLDDGQGSIHLDELNVGGFCVILKNLSPNKVDLGGWTLQSINEHGTHGTFVFPPSFELESNCATRIWAATAPAERVRPDDLLWQTQNLIYTSIGSQLSLTNANNQLEFSVQLVHTGSANVVPPESSSLASNCSVM